MIKGDFSDRGSLEEFYSAIESEHRRAHGNDYTLHHQDIIKLVQDCNSYRELGVNQGGTAAAAVLSNPKIVDLVDFDLRNFAPYQRLFFDYAKDYQMDINVYMSDSRNKALNFVQTKRHADFLTIDTVHTASHVIQELDIHAPLIDKYILIHDTGTVPEIHTAASDALKGVFELVKWEKRGSGHSLFKRI